VDDCIARYGVASFRISIACWRLWDIGGGLKSRGHRWLRISWRSRSNISGGLHLWGQPAWRLLRSSWGGWLEVVADGLILVVGWVLRLWRSASWLGGRGWFLHNNRIIVNEQSKLNVKAETLNREIKLFYVLPIGYKYTS
jgi:hypothetical protein